MPKQGWAPSQQPANQYAGGGTGYTDSEQYWMELLAAECHKQWVEQRTGIPDIILEGGSWKGQVSLSNSRGVTHHVALHSNAGGGIGAEIWHHTDSSEGKRMANAIYKHLAPATDTPDRGVKASRKYGELNNTKAVAVIIEVQFHDSASGAAEIRRSIKEFATAIVHGMCDYHGVAYKPIVSTPQRPPAAPVPPVTKPPATPVSPSPSHGGKMDHSITILVRPDKEKALLDDLKPILVKHDVYADIIRYSSGPYRAPVNPPKLRTS